MSKYLTSRILRELESHRLSILAVRQKKHLVITVTNPIGAVGAVVLSKTPSNRKNYDVTNRAMIRKTANSLLNRPSN